MGFNGIKGGAVEESFQFPDHEWSCLLSLVRAVKGGVSLGNDFVWERTVGVYPFLACPFMRKRCCRRIDCRLDVWREGLIVDARCVVKSRDEKRLETV